MKFDLQNLSLYSRRGERSALIVEVPSKKGPQYCSDFIMVPITKKQKEKISKRFPEMNTCS